MNRIERSHSMIGEINGERICLIERHADPAVEIVTLKKERALPMRLPARESAVDHGPRHANQRQVNDRDGGSFFRLIIREPWRLENPPSRSGPPCSRRRQNSGGPVESWR